jgi:hypothetical protein
VKERRGGERERRSGPLGGCWARRRHGLAGLSCAAGKTWASGRGKEGGELGCWAEREGVRGLGVLFSFFKPFFKTFSNFKHFKLFSKFSNKL